MQHGPSTSTDRAGAAPADAAQSDRTRALLEQLRAQCGDWLRAPLKRGLNHFARQLQARADASLNHLEQKSFQNTIERVVEQRDVFDRHFIACIEQAFEHPGRTAGASSATAPRGLSLLDTDTQDLDASLDQLVARSKARGGQALIELGYRMGVLMGSAPIDSAELPVGPQAMAQAFRDASGALDIPAAHELLLLQSLESSLIDELASLHELVNGHLRDAGILRGLRPFALPRERARKQSSRPITGAPHAAVPVHRDVPAMQAQPAAEAPPATDAATQATGTVSDAQLQVALAALQEHFIQVSEGTWFKLIQPERLREELLLQINIRRAADAGRVDLSATQERTLGLIVRLFAKIAQDLPKTPDAQSLLYNLQLPLLRIALKDDRFFKQSSHPARQVLRRISEIARYWLDDASESPHHELRIDIEALIIQAGRAEPDAALFESLLEHIEQRVDSVQEETRQAEAQQVDAMRGLEHLEAARERTAGMLQAMVAGSADAQALLARMQPAWRDVLALTLLRNGEDSTVFSSRLHVTEQVLGQRPLQDPGTLKQELEIGFRQIGMIDSEIDAAVSAMLDACRAGRQSATAAVKSEPLTASRQGIDPDVLRIHRHLRGLPAGTWFEFRGEDDAPSVQRRLAWYSPLSGHALFVTRSGRRAQELGELKLAEAIAAGRVRERDSTDENVADHAWHEIAADQDGVTSSRQRGGS